MTLEAYLDLFVNENFLVTVDGLWSELSFEKYEDEKKMDYWQKYNSRIVVGTSLLMTNGIPEIVIKLVD